MAMYYLAFHRDEFVFSTVFVFQYCVQFNDCVIASGSADSTVCIWNHHGKPLLLVVSTNFLSKTVMNIYSRNDSYIELRINESSLL